MTQSNIILLYIISQVARYAAAHAVITILYNILKGWQLPNGF